MDNSDGIDIDAINSNWPHNTRWEVRANGSPKVSFYDKGILIAKFDPLSMPAFTGDAEKAVEVMAVTMRLSTDYLRHMLRTLAGRAS